MVKLRSTFETPPSIAIGSALYRKELIKMSNIYGKHVKGMMKNRQRNLNYNFKLQTVYKWWLINRN